MDEQDLGVRKQGPGESQHLAHARGIGVEPQVGGGLQAGEAQDVGDLAGQPGPAEPVEGAEELKVLPAGEPPIEAPLVVDRVADGAPDGSGGSFGIVAADGRRSPVGEDKRRQDLDEGRLAGAVRPEQAEGAARFDLEADPVEGRPGPPLQRMADELAEPADDGIALDQVFDQDRRGVAHGIFTIRRTASPTGFESRRA